MRAPVLAALLAVAAEITGLVLAGRPELRPTLWGFDAWTFLGERVPELLVPAGLAAAAWTTRGRRVLGGRIGVAVLLLTGIPAMFLLSDRGHLLGDGRFWIAAVRGPAVYHAHEPFAFAFAEVVGRLGGDDPVRIARALEIASTLLGVAGLALVTGIARRAGRSDGERMLVAGSLVLGGLAPLAFGYVEAYPSLAAVTLLVVFLGLAPVFRVRDAVLLGLAAGLAAGTHLLGFLLLPAATWRAWTARRDPGSRLAFLAAAAVPVLVAYAILPRLTPGANGEAAGLGAAATGAWSLAEHLRLPAYGPTAWLVDQANRWMLLAPLSLALLPAALMFARLNRRSRRRDAAGFLLLAALPVLPAFFLDPEGSRGSAFDWDAFAAVTPAVATLIALGAAPMLASRAGRFVLAAASMTAAFAVGAFVLVNADTGAAVARAETLAAAARTESSRALAYETFALFHRDRGDSTAAALAYLDAARHDRGNARLWRNAAALFTRAGDDSLAAEAYRGLVGAGPTDAGTWFRAGLAMEAAGDVAEARAAWREAIALDPDDPGPLNKLAESLLAGVPTDADAREAYGYLRRSLAVDPEQRFAPAMRHALEALEARGVADTLR